MTTAYVVRRMALTLEARTYAQGERLDGAAVARLKAGSLQHLLARGRVVLVLAGGEEVAGPAAALAVNTRAKAPRPSTQEVREAVRHAAR